MTVAMDERQQAQLQRRGQAVQHDRENVLAERDRGAEIPFEHAAEPDEELLEDRLVEPIERAQPVDVACDAPGGSIIAIGSPGAMRMTTKTMTATPKSVISVVTLRVRIPRSAVMGSPGQAQLSSPAWSVAETRGSRNSVTRPPIWVLGSRFARPRMTTFALPLRCQPAGFIR